MREPPDCLKACHFHSVYRAEQLPLAGREVVGDEAGSRAVVPLASGNQKGGGGREERKKGRKEDLSK